MIGSASSINTVGSNGKTGARNAVDHVLKEEDNELVQNLTPDMDPDHFAVLADTLAEMNGAKKSVRHVSFSPDQALSADQERRLFDLYAQEFGIADPSSMLIMKHTKQRTDGTSVPHYHILTPETDASGKKLDDKFYIMRNEKLARIAEHEFGHTMQRGRHSEKIVEFLEKNEPHRRDLIAAIRGTIDDSPVRPQGAYTSSQHQASKREGIPLPAIKEAVKAAFKDLSRGDLKGRARAIQALEQRFGIKVTDGNKSGFLVLKTDAGKTLGSLNRLAGMSVADMKELQQKLPILRHVVAQEDAVKERQQRQQHRKDTSNDNDENRRAGIRSDGLARSGKRADGDKQLQKRDQRCAVGDSTHPRRGSDARQQGQHEPLRRTDRDASTHGRESSSASRNLGGLNQRVDQFTQQNVGHCKRGISNLIHRAAGRHAAARRAAYDIPGMSAVGTSYPPGSPQPAPDLSDPLLLAKLQFGRTDTQGMRL